MIFKQCFYLLQQLSEKVESNKEIVKLSDGVLHALLQHQNHMKHKRKNKYL